MNEKQYLYRKVSPSILILALFVLSAFALSVYLYLSAPKIAYVRSLDLVYGYNGMKQAHAEYKAQSVAWQANVDTLRLRYQRSLSNFQLNYKTFSSAERAEQTALLQRMEQDLNKYSKAVQDEAKSREATLTQGVLNQINGFVQKYAEENGFDIVIGAEGDGTVLYGSSKIDITADVLEALNKDYKIMPQNIGTK